MDEAMRRDKFETMNGNKKTTRQDFLLKYIEQHHYISIEEITRLFSVTTQTARRDITALEEKGRVRKLHGGAALAIPFDLHTYHQRRIDRSEEKARIAQSVADLIPDGSTIFLDAGTTCEAIAQALVRKRNLQIVTYSLRSAITISENTNFSLAIPGGFVRPTDGGVFQENTPEFFRRFKFDYAIISVSGIDDDGDLCDDDYAEVAVVTAALKQSRLKILAVDSSKFGKRSLVKLGSLEIIDTLITTIDPPKSLKQILAERGINVIITDR